MLIYQLCSSSAWVSLHKVRTDKVGQWMLWHFGQLTFTGISLPRIHFYSHKHKHMYKVHTCTLNHVHVHNPH